VATYLGAALIGALLPTGATGHGSGPVAVCLLSGPIQNDFVLPADPETRAAYAFAQDAEFLHRAGLRIGCWTPTPFAVTLSLWMYHPDQGGSVG